MHGVNHVIMYSNSSQTTYKINQIRDLQFRYENNATPLDYPFRNNKIILVAYMHYATMDVIGRAIMYYCM